MNSAEFDKFAEEYLALHAQNVRLTGEDPGYFARYKIDEVRRRWTGAGWPEPAAILDFGSGVGASLPHLLKAFPAAEITALDVSDRSLAIAKRRGIPAHFVCYEGGEIPLDEGKFHLVFSSCVFHHIDAGEHVDLFVRLRKLLSPLGRMVIFEHNPINPVTRYIVATCPFDENAVLIAAPELKARQMAAGFSKVEVAYTGFFPRALRSLRPLERYMTGLPVGAQYYTLAHG